MSTFIIRILFSGLMAFVPSEDGHEVTVLLLNADHYHTSDGAAMQPHRPMVIVRGNCSGDCTPDSGLAQSIFGDQSLSAANDSLDNAIGDGGAWLLSGSDLTINKASSGAADLPALVVTNNVRGTSGGQPRSIPTTSTEREDISWIANLGEICGSGCTTNADLFDSVPPGLVAARFHLRSGKVFTWSVARIGSDVTPVNFKRLDGTGSTSSYSQAVATWVAAEIEVTGDSIEIAEEKFNSDPGRSMILSPDNSGTVEVAVLNLPPFVPPSSTYNDDPQVGKHFETYYDLFDTPPAQEERLVPRPGAASGVTVPEVSWSSVHPSNAVYSELLNRLRLDVGRSVYDRTLCPPGGMPHP
jgi:hypothetical protein